MFDDTLIDHVVYNGRIFLGGLNVYAETQAHDAGRSDRLACQTKLLVGNIVAIDDNTVIEVVTLDMACIEVSNIESTTFNDLKGFALVRIDCWNISVLACLTTSGQGRCVHCVMQ